MTLGTGHSERSERVLQESGALRDLRRMSEARGMTFYMQPPRKIVPEFLGNYRPDAIALGSDGGIIIEVKHRRSRRDEMQLAEISRRVSGQKGWEFRVIYLNSSYDKTPIGKPTWPQLYAALGESEALAAGGHHGAALVGAWAVLEALARLAGDGDAGPSSGSPLQAVQALAADGFVEKAVADRLRGLVGLRDAVVHGDLSVKVPADQVEALARDLRAIASEVEAIA